MNASSVGEKLDLSPTGLFPNRKKPDQDSQMPNYCSDHSRNG